MNHRPSPNGPVGSAAGPGRDGRDQRGRFAPGNAGGPGNPHGETVGKLRSALIAAVSEDDIRAIVAGLVTQAKGGSVPAAKELLERVLGKPLEWDIIDRLDALERRAAGEVPQ